MGLGPLFLQTAQLKDRDDREARIHNDHESQTMVKARGQKGSIRPGASLRLQI